MAKKPKRIRLQIELSPESVATMEAITKQMSHPSNVETIRKALSVYRFFIEESVNNQVQIIGKDSTLKTIVLL